jgi:hypothetical protein
MLRPHGLAVSCVRLPGGTATLEKAGMSAQARTCAISVQVAIVRAPCTRSLRALKSGSCCAVYPKIGPGAGRTRRWWLRLPSAATSATHSSVVSQGMLGWSHCTYRRQRRFISLPGRAMEVLPTGHKPHLSAGNFAGAAWGRTFRAGVSRADLFSHQYAKDPA